MKTIFKICLCLLISINLYAQNKYSTEIECYSVLTNNVDVYLRIAESEIDLEKFKTVIRNGDISTLENTQISDMQLGSLTKTELKLLRNMYYAKEGYIFNDEELTKYFNQFYWYKPKTKDISFSRQKKNIIERIKLFEDESTIEYPIIKDEVIWKYWNYGADQKAPELKLKKDLSFEYTPWEGCTRLMSVEGKWSIADNKIELMIEEEKVLFGGYLISDDCPYIENGSIVVINYEKPIKIILPINKSLTYEEYKFPWGKNWIQIGSYDCFME